MISGPTSNERLRQSSAWRASPWVANVIRLVAFVIPLAGAWLLVRLVGPALYRPEGVMGMIVWMVQAIVVGTIAATVIDRWSRRLLPLAALFGMSLVFPDRAPSRFGMALRLGSVGRLKQRAAEAVESSSTAQEAAEHAVELVATLSRHDRLTRGHSERVRAYADVIAEELDLGEFERVRLAWAALLHDVGKLAVPAEILNKDGRPTTEEWATLAEHPAHSAGYLGPLAGWLGEWTGAATEHHERWDGAGYPSGIAGTDISLAGRITAVADAYDTMVSKRSYKEAVTPEAARRELVQCAGKQFDPEVVRAFLNVSLGRRWLAGPFAWLAETPTFGSALNGLGAAPSAIIASVAVVGSMAAGVVPSEPESGPADLAFAFDETPPTSLTTVPAVSLGDAASASLSSPRISTTTTTIASPTTTATTTRVSSTTFASTTAPPTTAPPATTAPPTTAPPTTAPPTTAPPPTTVPPLPPVANTDFAVIDAGSGDDIAVLDNDVPGSAPLDIATLSIVDPPSHAVDFGVDDGEIFYEADERYLGPDTLNYRICNTMGLCAIGKVAISVVPD